jgi:glutamyl-tRNA synthetase
MSVRVRFAPSPTGQPHIGNVRTALFNWLFARRHGGKFLVRIEDTDQQRLVPGALEGILDSLRWLGIDWDEGPEVDGPYAPYFQSQRLPVYKDAVDSLMARGHAYRCFCTPERLDAMRKEQMKNKQPPGYDGRCLRLSLDEKRDLEAFGVSSVVRFHMPDEGAIRLDDLIRGEVTWQSELIDDFVMLKSDGFPTYHLANVVDDHHMEVTHVLRAEEWLPSTPRHLKLYEAFDWQPPLFGHLPMILGPDRSKLSKRHGATSVLEYREKGYLPDALLNFMALLGWSLDDKTEVMDRRTLQQNFSLERVVKSAAIFNIEKLDWMNGVYIRNLTEEQLCQTLLEFWKSYPPAGIPLPVDRAYLVRILPLIHERLKNLAEAASLISFFFDDSFAPNVAEMQKAMDAPRALPVLKSALENLETSPAFDAKTLEERLRALGEQLGLGPRQFFGLLRVAVTGATVSPPLFETMEVLGRERCLQRITAAIDALTSQSPNSR